MAKGLWLYGPDYDGDEGGAVAVVESSNETGQWRMTVVVTGETADLVATVPELAALGDSAETVRHAQVRLDQAK